MLSISGYASITPWPHKINWSPPTASLLARKTTYQLCAPLLQSLGTPSWSAICQIDPQLRKGIFLGFIPNTDKNVIWCDTETHVVKIAKHVRFDEGMNDLLPGLVPPNAVHLQRTQNGEPLPAETEETSVVQFAFHLNPFSHTVVKGVQVTDDDPSYGLTLASDELNHRAYVTDFKENSTADKLCATHKSTLKNAKGACLVGINGKRVFGKDDAISMLRQLCHERADNLQLELCLLYTSPSPRD